MTSKVLRFHLWQQIIMYKTLNKVDSVSATVGHIETLAERAEEHAEETWDLSEQQKVSTFAFDIVPSLLSCSLAY